MPNAPISILATFLLRTEHLHVTLLGGDIFNTKIIMDVEKSAALIWDDRRITVGVREHPVIPKAFVVASLVQDTGHQGMLCVPLGNLLRFGIFQEEVDLPEKFGY
jgi:hypothetical protein